MENEATTAGEATTAAVAGAAVLIGRHHDISAFASTDVSRYVLNGVHYNARLGVVEATDGYALVRVPVCRRAEEFPPVKAGEATLEDCIIPVAAFKKALANTCKTSALPVLQCARLSGADGKVTMAASDLETEQAVTVKGVEGTYPDCDQVIPAEEPTLTITVAASLLKRVAEYAERHGRELNTGGVPITFEFIGALSAIRFSVPLDDAMGETPVARGVLMPMRLA